MDGVWNCKLCDYKVDTKRINGLTAHLFSGHNIRRVDGGFERYFSEHFDRLLCCCGCGNNVKLSKRCQTFELFAPGCKGLNRSRTPGCIDFYIYEGMDVDEAIETFRLRQKFIATKHSTEELRNKLSECNSGANNPASISSIMKRTGKDRRVIMSELSIKSSGTNNGFYGKTHDNESLIKIARTKSICGNKNVTKPEMAIWGILHGLGINHFQFEEPIDRYTVDFKINNIIIEVFGDYWHNSQLKMQHYKKKCNDDIKIAKLRSLGYTVEVIWESEIFKQTQLVVERLRKLFCAN